MSKELDPIFEKIKSTIPNDIPGKVRLQLQSVIDLRDKKWGRAAPSQPTPAPTLDSPPPSAGPEKAPPHVPVELSAEEDQFLQDAYNEAQEEYGYVTVKIVRVGCTCIGTKVLASDWNIFIPKYIENIFKKVQIKDFLLVFTLKSLDRKTMRWTKRTNSF